MTKPLTSLITEAVFADRNLHLLANRLKLLKQLLIAAAADSREGHDPTRGGGTSWVAEGDDGCIARVCFPGPALPPLIDPRHPSTAQLLEKLGPRKERLLRTIIHYEPVDDFRERVRRLFGREHARAIIAACETPCPPRVSFETKVAA